MAQQCLNWLEFWPELQQTGFPLNKLSRKTARGRLEKSTYSLWPWICLFGSQWSIRSMAVYSCGIRKNHMTSGVCSLLVCKYWDMCFKSSWNSGFSGTPCPSVESKKLAVLSLTHSTRLAQSRVGPWQQALTDNSSCWALKAGPKQWWGWALTGKKFREMNKCDPDTSGRCVDLPT